MKTFVLFIAIAFTVFFINDKFSKAVRVIAFNEDESKRGMGTTLVAATVISL